MASLMFVSCEKEQNKSVPVPPSVASLEVDLSSFSQASTKAGDSSLEEIFTFASTKAGDSTLDEFFTFASTQVLQNWMTIYEKIINLPVYAYNLVINSEPTPSGNGYVWNCSYKDSFGQTYEVNLYGENVGERVNWQLNVSKKGLLGFEDFTWIEGWSSIDGKNGQWSVRVSPIDTDVVVKSDWSSSAEGKVERVKLTYTLNHLCLGINPFFNGSYIEYLAEATDPAYDSSITANYNHMGEAFWTVLLEWNSLNGAGRVQSQNRFGDSSWHVWAPRI